MSRLDVAAIGRAGMLLGAGRARSSDVINHAVGFDFAVRLGDRVEAGQVLAKVEYDDADRLEAARPVFLGAIELGDEAPQIPPLVRERL